MLRIVILICLTSLNISESLLSVPPQKNLLAEPNTKRHSCIPDYIVVLKNKPEIGWTYRLIPLLRRMDAPESRNYVETGTRNYPFHDHIRTFEDRDRKSGSRINPDDKDMKSRSRMNPEYRDRKSRSRMNLTAVSQRRIVLSRFGRTTCGTSHCILNPKSGWDSESGSEVQIMAIKILDKDEDDRLKCRPGFQLGRTWRHRWGSKLGYRGFGGIKSTEVESSRGDPGLASESKRTLNPAQASNQNEIKNRNAVWKRSSAIPRKIKRSFDGRKWNRPVKHIRSVEKLLQGLGRDIGKTTVDKKSPREQKKTNLDDRGRRGMELRKLVRGSFEGGIDRIWKISSTWKEPFIRKRSSIRKRLSTSNETSISSIWKRLSTSNGPYISNVWKRSSTENGPSISSIWKRSSTSNEPPFFSSICKKPSTTISNFKRKQPLHKIPQKGESLTHGEPEVRIRTSTVQPETQLVRTSGLLMTSGKMDNDLSLSLNLGRGKGEHKVGVSGRWTEARRDSQRSHSSCIAQAEVLEAYMKWRINNGYGDSVSRWG